jgi:hypothetical protein
MPIPRSIHACRWPGIALIAMLAVGAAASQAAAPPGLVETAHPSAADPGMPFYVRIDGRGLDGHVWHDDEYAIVVFYRGPAGIPADFDLLDMFDVPAAFGVEANVAGTNAWHEQPGSGSPFEAKAHGVGPVPVWFVPIAPLQALIASGSLTMPDMEAIEGILVGHADAFEETLRPHALPPEMGGGGHPDPSLTLSASGVLEDGRRFELVLTGEETPDGWQRTTSRRFE